MLIYLVFVYYLGSTLYIKSDLCQHSQSQYTEEVSLPTSAVRTFCLTMCWPMDPILHHCKCSNRCGRGGHSDLWMAGWPVSWDLLPGRQQLIVLQSVLDGSEAHPHLHDPSMGKAWGILEKICTTSWSGVQYDCCSIKTNNALHQAGSEVANLSRHKTQRFWKGGGVLVIAPP